MENEKFYWTDELQYEYYKNFNEEEIRNDVKLKALFELDFISTRITKEVFPLTSTVLVDHENIVQISNSTINQTITEDVIHNVTLDFISRVRNIIIKYNNVEEITDLTSIKNKIESYTKNNKNVFIFVPTGYKLNNLKTIETDILKDEIIFGIKTDINSTGLVLNIRRCTNDFLQKIADYYGIVDFPYYDYDYTGYKDIYNMIKIKDK